MQFLVRTTSFLPPDFDADARQQLLAEEKARCSELTEAGKIVGHWRIPISRESVTVWEVVEPGELHELVMSLPASKWAHSVATALVVRNLQNHSKDPSQKIA
jgi:muconolactone D-isomerase